MLKIKTLLRHDFQSFVARAFRELNGGEKLEGEYLQLLCYKLDLVAKGKTKRLLINLPPRHSKTFTAAICLSAWKLGHEPSAKIIIVTYNEKLAKAIAYSIRRILQQSWFQKIFSTRLAKDRSGVDDFSTEQGGSVLAISADGSITGRGASLIVYDDPVNIRDAENMERLQKVNENFDTIISSRLDNPKTGQIVIVAHRLSEFDLSGHVLSQGGWQSIALPLIATRAKTYKIGKKVWLRKKGDLLRPDAYDKRTIRTLRRDAKNPPFDTFYQQSVARGSMIRLKRKYFTIGYDLPAGLPVVLSIDAGQRGGPKGSFSVIQAWVNNGKDFILIKQWRARCDFEELRKKAWAYFRKYRPAAVLIEDAANGSALISNLSRKARVPIVPIALDGRSKATRLNVHMRTLRAGHVFLSEEGDWQEAFIREMIEFPRGPNDDQIDAMTQYLDFIGENPVLVNPPAPAIGGVAHSWSPPVAQPQMVPSLKVEPRAFVAIAMRRVGWWR